MINVYIDKYKIGIEKGSIPTLFDDYLKNALLYEEYITKEYDGEDLVIAVSIDRTWPSLVIKMRYSPSVGGFDPGIFLDKETDVLFIGAGQTVLVYDLKRLIKIDEDFYNEGFLRWRKYKNYIFLFAECDLACWENSGKKLWQRFADPPYDIIPNEDKVILKMLDESVEINIKDGS